MAASIRPLDPQHEVKDFSCGVAVLDAWLQQTARQHQEKNLSRTYVLVDDENEKVVLGFYALSICEVRPGEVTLDIAKRLPRIIPALRLGRLAVHASYQGKQIGAMLLVDAMVRSKELSRHAGGYALFVDAKDEQAAAFYLKYGFIQSPDNPLKLFISMKSIPG